MPTTDLPINPTSRAAEQKRKAAARARKSRERRKAAGAPDTRALDMAISEAVSFHLARDGVGANIAPIMLMKTARLVLEREGYDPAASAQALAGRLGHRPEHMWPDFVPTLKPGPADHMRPTKAGPWTTPMSSIMAHLAGRQTCTASRADS